MNDRTETESIVIKVGGSLYDFPQLSSSLHRFLDSIKPSNIAIFPGGGPFADAVRVLD